MKIYHFNPNDYGSQFFLIAESKLKAHEYLINYLRLKSASSNYYREELNMWLKVNPLDSLTFPMKYTLDEAGVGHVIGSEVA